MSFIQEVLAWGAHLETPAGLGLGLAVLEEDREGTSQFPSCQELRDVREVSP